MRRAPVAVVGDVMLDRYIWGQVERISPEAPVPVVAVEDTSLRLGGAANVAWNLASLGVPVRLAGVLGRDQSARDIKKMLREKGLSSEGLVVDSRRVTTEKIRIIAHHQQVVRADFETAGDMEEATLRKLLASVKRAVSGARVVIVSDYGKGVVSNEVMDAIRELTGRAGIAGRTGRAGRGGHSGRPAKPVLIDPKEGHFSLYRRAFALTPNKKEAGGFYNRKIRREEELLSVGASLLEDLEAEAILITRGEEGMTLFERGRGPKNFPTRASEVYDVTGAGDTVISLIGAGLAAGATLYESIELANAAAGIVVRELGTAAVTRPELEAAFPA